LEERGKVEKEREKEEDHYTQEAQLVPMFQVQTLQGVDILDVLRRE